MYKYLLRILLIVVIVSTAVMPALAQDEHTCPHHGTAIGNLRGCVAHAAEHGHITNAGIANALLSKLDAAQAAFDRGQLAAAANLVNAFIHNVEAQAGKHIDANHAAHMVEHARQVLAALGA